MTGRPLVAVVDDDESLREAIPDALGSFGFDVQVFASAEEFLASAIPDDTQCILLDVAMPGMSGPMLQQELRRRGSKIPIVFITAHWNPVLCSQLIARGAIECLLKPVSEAALLDAVRRTRAT